MGRKLKYYYNQINSLMKLSVKILTGIFLLALFMYLTGLYWISLLIFLIGLLGLVGYNTKRTSIKAVSIGGAWGLISSILFFSTWGRCALPNAMKINIKAIILLPAFFSTKLTCGGFLGGLILYPIISIISGALIGSIIGIVFKKYKRK